MSRRESMPAPSASEGPERALATPSAAPPSAANRTGTDQTGTLRRAEPRRTRSAAECLAAALEAPSLDARASWARRGLATEDDELDPEIQFLLLRQLYIVAIEEERITDALALADQMLAIGVMSDLAEHDRGRVLFALGETRAAIEAQRHAARLAPPDRRSFQALALATFQCFTGDTQAALRSLERAERWSHRDRVLVRAFRVYAELLEGRVPEALEEARRALAASPLREGYGQFLLGMIALELGDRVHAGVHLRAFLRKNAAIDRAKELTLREELRRARKALAELESD